MEGGAALRQAVKTLIHVPPRMIRKQANTCLTADCISVCFDYNAFVSFHISFYFIYLNKRFHFTF